MVKHGKDGSVSGQWLLWPSPIEREVCEGEEESRFSLCASGLAL